MTDIPEIFMPFVRNAPADAAAMTIYGADHSVLAEIDLEAYRKGRSASWHHGIKGVSMQPHQERVVTEKRELDVKIDKLDEFRAGKIFPTLPEAE